jgi:carbamate kinase
MDVVIALGGNALLQRGDPLDADVQRRNVQTAVRAVAEVAERNAVVLTHGNGPQVGLLALQAAAYEQAQPYTLDILGALSEGMIGYILAQELTNHLPDLEVASLLTQVEVDPADPAFAHPTKPIGPVCTQEEARQMERERGWMVAPDGDHWRRVVPSPRPMRIRELATIHRLVEDGVLVVCAGGGGIPVVATEQGGCRGVEAVIDKDRSAALLAEELGADALLLLTDVAAVEADWGTPKARAIHHTTPAEMRRYDFAKGSMGPKVSAACRFVEATGGMAGIGALQDALAILEQRAGTVIGPAH